MTQLSLYIIMTKGFKVGLKHGVSLSIHERDLIGQICCGTHAHALNIIPVAITVPMML